MTTADEFEAEYGDPVFQTTFQAFAEGLDGNGILDAGDLAVTAGSNSNSLDVAATTRGLLYGGTVYTYAGATNVLTLTANSSGSPRWDLIYFDTGTSSPGKREGTPATKPDLPTLQAGEFPLAAVYVADGQTDVSDSEIKNYRVHAGDAAETYVDDSPGLYSGDTVESALTSELQYAAQLTGYPLPLADLSSPYALPSITDMDAAGTDLTDSSGPGVLYDASAGVVLQSVLGGPASSLSAYPLAPGTDLNVNAYPFALGDLASPFSLPSITDMDAAGNDLVDGATTVWDTSAGVVPRAVVDQNRNASSVSSNTTTSDEEVIFVDTSGGAVTITLASADAVNGNHIIVVDSGGSVETNAITIATEGSETIDGGSTVTLDTNYGAQVLSSDGTNWFTAGGGSGGGGGVVIEENGSVLVDPATAINFGKRLDPTDDGDGTVTVDAGGDPNEEVRMNESGNVGTASGDVVFTTQVPDGSTFEIRQAGLLLVDGTAAPTDLDLVIATLDNAGAATKQDTVIDGDGTVQNDLSGAGVGTYANSTGAEQTVALIVDNGQFNAGSGSAQDYVTEAIGEVHTGSSALVASDLEELRANETGTVSAGNVGVVATTQVPDGSTFEIRQAGLLLLDGQPAPSGLDLVILTMDNAGAATLQTTVLTGDGTVQGDATGNPVASHSNSSGGEQTVALAVDNGNFNTGTGSAQDIVTEAIAEVVV